MEGRYVNIGPGRLALNLCEVEVYAAPTAEPLANVALNGEAQQSSIYGNLSASKAINGITKGIVIIGSVHSECCSITNKTSSPWWKVDLKAVHRIRAVTIFNRQDCCPERLTQAQIKIGNTNSPANPICGTISEVKASYTFHCGDMVGRYVFVHLPKVEHLQLAEVEVYASLEDVTTPPPPTVPPTVPPTAPPPPPTMSTLLDGRNVTLVGERLCWSDALFYCRHHHLDLLSLHSQEEQSQVEELLSRSPFPTTDYVWMGLRRMVMGDEWFWMSGKPMHFTKWKSNNAPDYIDNACGAMAREEHFLWDDQPCEKLLNFLCQSSDEDGVRNVYFYSSRKYTFT
ncbi:pentraxin fusion protein-like [Notolabrus celidotus]|uniref:pentraxin fusion protein-like n=1 Tax=Notolabrus celidotus TaxID=1203425 RepID=UPI00149005F4|nr:pentraxin fusion protein-like [Notolabrus celidotus]